MNLGKPKFKIWQYVKCIGNEYIYFWKIIHIRVNIEDGHFEYAISIPGNSYRDLKEKDFFEITEEEKNDFFIEGFFKDKNDECVSI